MRVLQIAPLWFPITTDAPGGIESFLAQLVPALERRGCDLTLVASADSRTKAQLVPAASGGIVDAMREREVWEYSYHEQHLLHLVLEIAADFDVVHSHIGPAAYSLSAIPEFRRRVLHTVHTPVTPDMEWFFGLHPEIWISTVSAFQAERLRESGALRCTVIPNGISTARFEPSQKNGPGLVYLGRMEAVKGPDLAVRAARELNLPLILAGPIVEHSYFERMIEPSLGDGITYVGVADHDRKVALLGGAACAVLPFQRDEPFGLTVVEAMACGTPVVSFNSGAMPEIVEPGVTGYLVDDERDVANAVLAALKLDRTVVRTRAMERFDIDAVAEAYHRLYSHIAQEEGAGGTSE